MSQIDPSLVEFIQEVMAFQKELEREAQQPPPPVLTEKESQVKISISAAEQAINKERLRREAKGMNAERLVASRLEDKLEARYFLIKCYYDFRDSRPDIIQAVKQLKTEPSMEGERDKLAVMLERLPKNPKPRFREWVGLKSEPN